MYGYLCPCMYAYCTHASCAERSEEGIVSLSTGVTSSCKLPDKGSGTQTRVLEQQMLLN